jgi:hypothetical protein
MRVAEGARADTRTAAKPTADQMHVLKMLEQLAGAADWRGVAAQGRAARTVAAAVRTFMPAATQSPLCPAFHALIWQQQRERVRVGEGERR